MHYTEVKNYYLTKTRLLDELGREPTEMELSEELDWTPDLVQEAENLQIEKDDDSIDLRFKVSVWNENIRRLRLAKILTQSQAAEKIGIGVGILSQVETCHYLPSLKMKKKIADFYGQPVEQLFPKWLECFSKKWADQETERLVSYKAEQIEGAEAQFLLAPIDLEREAEIMLIREKLNVVLAKITPRERAIIEYRYGLIDKVTHDLRETGKYFDVSRERIRQIESKAFERIKDIGILF